MATEREELRRQSVQYRQAQMQLQQLQEDLVARRTQVECAANERLRTEANEIQRLRDWHDRNYAKVEQSSQAEEDSRTLRQKLNSAESETIQFRQLGLSEQRLAELQQHTFRIEEASLKAERDREKKLSTTIIDQHAYLQQEYANAMKISRELHAELQAQPFHAHADKGRRSERSASIKRLDCDDNISVGSTIAASEMEVMMAMIHRLERQLQQPEIVYAVPPLHQESTTASTPPAVTSPSPFETGGGSVPVLQAAAGGRDVSEPAERIVEDRPRVLRRIPPLAPADINPRFQGLHEDFEPPSFGARQRVPSAGDYPHPSSAPSSYRGTAAEALRYAADSQPSDDDAQSQDGRHGFADRRGRGAHTVPPRRLDGEGQFPQGSVAAGGTLVPSRHKEMIEPLKIGELKRTEDYRNWKRSVMHEIIAVSNVYVEADVAQWFTRITRSMEELDSQGLDLLDRRLGSRCASHPGIQGAEQPYCQLRVEEAFCWDVEGSPDIEAG